MKRRWFKVFVILVMLTVLGVGCAQQQKAAQNTAVAPSAPPVSDPSGSGYVKGSADAAVTGSPSYASSTEGESGASVDGTIARKVIQTGRMELEVLDYAKANAEIAALVQSAGGYIESTSSRRDDEGRVYATVTVRVPQPKFDQLLADLSKSGKIISSEVSGRDVTEQYIDLEARLKNAKAQEERMLAILEKAATLDELLKVEAELARIRGEVESLQGRFNYLKHNVDLASLAINVREVDSFTTKVKTPGWDIWERIQRAFISSLNMIIDVAVGSIVAVIGFSPLIILLGALYLLVRRFIRDRLRARGVQNPKAGDQSGDETVTK